MLTGLTPGLTYPSMTSNRRFTTARLTRHCARAALCLVATNFLNAETLEERLAKLEKRLSAVESENAVLRRQVGSGDTATVMAGGREKKLSLGGFIHAHYESGEPSDARFAGIYDRFLLRRARLGATASFAEDIGFKIEADFGNNSISPRTGASGQITDVYATWTKFSYANVRLGQFKTPFGFEQLTSDTKTIMVERGLANDRLTLGRQIGAAVMGDVAEKRISYSVGAFNGAGTNNGGNDSSKFLWVGRVAGTPWQGSLAGLKSKITVGTNVFTTEDKGTFIGRRYGWGVDSQLVVGPAELQAEWLRNDQHPAVGRPTAADGWSLLGAISITPRIQGVLRYEEFDSNTLTSNTTTELWTVGFNYFLKGDDLKLSLNYALGSQPAPAQDGGRFLARVQVVF